MTVAGWRWRAGEVAVARGRGCARGCPWAVAREAANRVAVSRDCAGA